MRRRSVMALGAVAGLTWTGLAAAQGRFKMQTVTPLGATRQGWSFQAFSNGDLVGILRKGTNNKTEVHVLSASHNYQRFIHQTETALGVSDDTWDFVALPSRDLMAINRKGGSARADVHILDAGKDYKAFKLQIATPLQANDRRWSFGANGSNDLVCINRLGESGKTEVHVLDGSRKYDKFKVQAVSALPATDSGWDFGVVSSGDVVGIKRRGESGKTELHVLEAGAGYGRFKRQAPTPLEAADDTWRFAVAGNGDVLAVLTREENAGKTEVNVFGST